MELVPHIKGETDGDAERETETEVKREGDREHCSPSSPSNLVMGETNEKNASGERERERPDALSGGRARDSA